MKKLISLLLAASISFCLAACGNSASLPNNSEAGPGNDSQGDVKRITIGTAGTSGALYPMHHRHRRVHRRLHREPAQPP